jgi:hypothetical protein
VPRRRGRKPAVNAVQLSPIWILLAEDLIRPLDEGYQIGGRYEPGILFCKIGVADRTGP